jgi:hypothetical protein
MAFSYTVTAPNTTGVLKSSQQIGPNLVRYRGTFTAGGDVKGTLDLTDTTKTNLGKAAVHVYACGVEVGGGTLTAQHKWKMNVDMDAAAAEGKIGLLLIANNQTGYWWADVVV